MRPSFDVRPAFLLVVAMPLLAAVPQAQRVSDASKGAIDAKRKAAATAIWTDHLKLETYPSARVVAPGDRVSLVVEIEPGARMHVYAPGADNYRLVTLTVPAQPFVQFTPIRYPPSEIYLFEPLNERIPVYQRPFKLVQEATLDTHPKAEAAFRGMESLTLKGTLDYQACDDRICFNPVSVPLSWTIALQPSAAQRQGRAPALK